MKLLPILLLFLFGCTTKPEPEDCAGVPGGAAELDNCNVCDTDKTNDCVQDCAEEWGGDTIDDCTGICGGDAVEDECGECGGEGIDDGACDCAGSIDAGCGCGEAGPSGCDETCGSTLENDACGVCGSDGIQQECGCGNPGELGIPAGACDCDGNVLDDCGICGGDGSNCITDIDGYWYKTVTIGTQLWMAENLKVTHYNNGDDIPTGLSSGTDGEWVNTTEGAYAVYPIEAYNISQTICDDDCAEIYGNLYNWYAVVDSRGVCPNSFHVPSDDEYTILTDYLGGVEVAGGKMKKLGNEHWKYYSDEISEEATNESGFTGLPAGYRYYVNGGYYSMGSYGYFWSSSEPISNYAWYRELDYNYSNVNRNYHSKRYGFSIRCLED